MKRHSVRILLLISIPVLTLLLSFGYAKYKRQIQKEVGLCLDSICRESVDSLLFPVQKQLGERLVYMKKEHSDSPRHVRVITKDTTEVCELNVALDSMNVTDEPISRIMYSIAFQRNGFQLSSFMQECRERLAAQGNQAQLCFVYSSKGKTYMEGDSTLIDDSWMVFDKVMGYANEYRLTGFCRLTFFFNVTVRIGFVILVGCWLFFILLCVWPQKTDESEVKEEETCPLDMCTCSDTLVETKMEVPLVQKWKEGDKDKYVFKNEIVYYPAMGQFFEWNPVKKEIGRKLLLLTNKHTGVFNLVLEEYPQGLSREDLEYIVWKQTSQSSASTAVARLNRQLKEIKTFRVRSKNKRYFLEIS